MVVPYRHIIGSFHCSYWMVVDGCQKPIGVSEMHPLRFYVILLVFEQVLYEKKRKEKKLNYVYLIILQIP